MLDFYGIDFTTKDHPNYFSVVLYTNGCNLRCYGCHNRLLAGWDYKNGQVEKGKDIVSVEHNNFYKKLTKDEVEVAIKNDFLDMVILCGGEVCIHPVDDILETISYIKEINPNLKIRIDTNGTFPEKTKILANYVDGFAIDIKGPYWDHKYYDDLSNVIGLPKKAVEYLSKKILESIKIADELKETIFRTVRYPIVNQEYLDEIKKYCDKNLKSPHIFTTFQEV